MFILCMCSQLVWKLTAFSVVTIIRYVVGLHLVLNLHYMCIVYAVTRHRLLVYGYNLQDRTRFSVMVCIVNMLIVKIVRHIAF